MHSRKSSMQVARNQGLGKELSDPRFVAKNELHFLQTNLAVAVPVSSFIRSIRCSSAHG